MKSFQQFRPSFHSPSFDHSAFSTILCATLMIIFYVWFRFVSVNFTSKTWMPIVLPKKSFRYRFDNAIPPRSSWCLQIYFSIFRIFVSVSNSNKQQLRETEIKKEDRLCKLVDRLFRWNEELFVLLLSCSCSYRIHAI